VHPESAKPPASAAIKLNLDICKTVASSLLIVFFACLARAPR
jgi:hypothetical protein